MLSRTMLSVCYNVNKYVDIIIYYGYGKSQVTLVDFLEDFASFYTINKYFLTFLAINTPIS